MRPVPPEVVPGSPVAPVVLTCEHASAALPGDWTWPEDDRWLSTTHWASDLGIAPVTRGLAAALGAPAILASFSRLLVDPNRPVEHPDLLRTRAEGRPIRMNTNVSGEERNRRIDTLYAPYHAEIDRQVAASRAPVVFAVHSFTPTYQGATREMEAGVLFDESEELAAGLADALRRDGLRVALNEPYSGRGGLIYSADRHARRHGRAALEVELRQDLLADPVQARRLVRTLARAVSAL